MGHIKDFSVNTEIQHYNATFDLPQNEAELEQVFKAFRMIYNEGLVQFQTGTLVIVWDPSSYLIRDFIGKNAKSVMNI